MTSFNPLSAKLEALPLRGAARRPEFTQIKLRP